MRLWEATLAILAALLASLAVADDFKTTSGREYKNAKVSRVEPDGIVLITKSGISKVYFTELPKEVQERFHYDPANAAAYSAQVNKAFEEARKRQEKAEPLRDIAQLKQRGFDVQTTKRIASICSKIVAARHLIQRIKDDPHAIHDKDGVIIGAPPGPGGWRPLIAIRLRGDIPQFEQEIREAQKELQGLGLGEEVCR